MDLDCNGQCDGESFFTQAVRGGLPELPGNAGSNVPTNVVPGAEGSGAEHASSNAVPVVGLLPVWRMGGVIYVDGRNGEDRLTGLQRSVVVRAGSGVAQDGPKRSIAAGLAAAQENRARHMEILDGQYGEDLNIAGRDVNVVIQGKVDLRGHGAGPAVVVTQQAASNGVVRNRCD